jgi:hypothetical protein
VLSDGEDRLPQAGQFVNDDVPDNTIRQTAIFMAQHVSNPGHTRPGNFGPLTRQVTGNRATGFRDDLKCSLDEPAQLPTALELFKRLAAGNLIYRPMASKMS